jgi:phage-related protein
MANSSASKNLAMQLIQGPYQGLKSIGKSIRKVVGGTLDKIERVHRLKDEKNMKIMEENFGSAENYRKLR